jgi:hypothetical protein
LNGAARPPGTLIEGADSFEGHDVDGLNHIETFVGGICTRINFFSDISQTDPAEHEGRTKSRRPPVLC